MAKPYKGKSKGDWKSGGPKKFGEKKPWERGSGANFAMHPATCNQCGKPCEVPFKPTGRRPVFCQACFRKNDGGDRDFDVREDRPMRSNAGSDVSAQLKTINEKLDRIIEALND